MVVPREVVYEKFRVPHIVKSYSRIPDVIEPPPLVQIQVDSYKVFIDEGLRELLDEIYPPNRRLLRNERSQRQI